MQVNLKADTDIHCHGSMPEAKGGCVCGVWSVSMGRHPIQCNANTQMEEFSNH